MKSSCRGALLAALVCLLALLCLCVPGSAAEYHMPLDTWPSITSPFYRNTISYDSSTGVFTAGTYGGTSIHGGIDLAATFGSNVYAITSGTVTYAGWEKTSSGGYGAGGRVLTLKGDDGNYYYYAHLNDFVVTSGRVSCGQLIAHSGHSASGSLTGAATHLHLTIGMPSAPTAAEYQRTVKVYSGSWTTMPLYNKKSYITGPGYSYYSVDPETFFYLAGLRSTTTWISKSGSSSGSGTVTDPCVTYGCSAANGCGTYVCTSTNGLNINSGHNYSSATGTVIPYGAEVTVTKMSSTGTYAHVTYNGVSGIASRNYLKKVEEAVDECTTYACAAVDVGWYTVTSSDGLELHSAHNYNSSSSIGTMPYGAKVYLTKHATNGKTYAHVIYNGTEGICSKNYLSLLPSYTIKFDGNGGTSPIASATVWQGVGDYCNVSQYTPSLVQYAFEGWYDSPVGGTKVYNADGTCVNDGVYWQDNCYCRGAGATLYAHWSFIYIYAESVTLSDDVLTLMTGENALLTAYVSPDDATDRNVTWVSDNTDCCTVSDEGELTAVGAGKSVITAYSNSDPNLYARCTVTVSSPVESVTLNRDVCYLTDDAPYDRTCLKVRLEPACGAEVVFSSDNTAIASVSDTGVITAIAPGSAMITASVTGGPSDYCMVYVLDTMEGVLTVPEGTLTIEDEAFAGTGAEIIRLPSSCLTIGSRAFADSACLKFLYLPVGAVCADDFLENCQYVTVVTAQDEDDCFVDSSGIPYVSDDSDKYVPAVSITISDAALALTTGESALLTAVVMPNNATDRGVVWSTSNAAVATVSNGRVTAVGAGTATIYAAAADDTELRVACAVTVTAPIKVIAVTGIEPGFKSACVTVGEAYALSPVITPSDATDKTLRYSSSDTSIATVGANGTVTGVSRGLAMVTIASADGGAKAQCLIAVNEACSCSTAYAGWYTVSGTDGTLNINDGHGYKIAEGFTAIASIPEGTKVYISEAQGAAGTSGKWGHVTYNGYSGFCSMYYLKADSGDLHDESTTVTITDHGAVLTDNYYIYNTSSVSVKECGYELFDANKTKIAQYSQSWNTASTKWSMDVKLDGGTTLSQNTTYYVQTYVVYNGTTHWGSAVGFTTSTAPVVTAPSTDEMLANLRTRASIPANRQQACYLVAEKLLDAGYSPAFTAGVIANILCEGGFGQFEYNGDSVTGKIPSSYNYSNYGGKYIYNGYNLRDVYDMAYALYYNEGGKGFGLGCMQWSFTRCLNLIKQYIAVIGKTTSTVTMDDTITAAQVVTAEANHMFNEMQSSYGTTVSRGITNRDARNTADAAFYGGWSVCKNYEKPANTYYSAGVRGVKAIAIWRAMMGL